MREVKTSGTICLDDEYNFTYYIADIKYIEREDESFRYEITPNYSVINLLSERIFQGIPGLDLSLKKECYVRENIIPVFISERTPGENREDLWVLLEKYDMKYLDRLEWLIRTDMRYSGDGLYVCKKEKENLIITSLEELGNRSSIISRKALEVICLGGNIVTDDFTIDDSNRRAYYNLFMAMYKTEKKYLDERRKEGIQKSAKKGNYVGRSRIKIGKLELKEVFDAYEAGKVSGRDAANMLQISAATFYRRYREYKRGAGDNYNI